MQFLVSTIKNGFWKENFREQQWTKLGIQKDKYQVRQQNAEADNAHGKIIKLSLDGSEKLGLVWVPVSNLVGFFCA